MFSREEIQILMDPKFIEHDSYYLFSAVMERVESWYDNHSIQTKVSSQLSPLLEILAKSDENNCVYH